MQVFSQLLDFLENYASFLASVGLDASVLASYGSACMQCEFSRTVGLTHVQCEFSRTVDTQCEFSVGFNCALLDLRVFSHLLDFLVHNSASFLEQVGFASAISSQAAFLLLHSASYGSQSVHSRN